MEGSSPTLTQVTIAGNETTGSYGSGGGMYLDASDPTLTQVTLTGNSTDYYGGGMVLSDSDPTLNEVKIEGNLASSDDSEGSGGGIWMEGSTPTLTQVTIEGNEAIFGGGMGLWDSSPTLTNSILAYNRASSGGNLYRRTDEYTPSSVTSNASLFYNPSGWGIENITPTGTYLTKEPKFLDYASITTGAACTPGSSFTCLPADLHPALGSPLINAGETSLVDVDGSRSDIGSYGGALGGSWDVDADGTPDYFWPGEWDDAPSGFDPNDNDCDDRDPDVQVCSR